MTFGGAPNPSQWSDVSGVITDIANNLVGRLDWDPEVSQSPHQHLRNSDEAVDNDEGAVDLSAVIRMDDVRFRRHGEETLPTRDQVQLQDVDAVTITFRKQKNGDK